MKTKDFKNQERSERELAIRFKRQRNATEGLHKFARKYGITLATDAIAEPKRVVMDDDPHHRVGRNCYCIVSEGGKVLLMFNMVSGSVKAIPMDASIELKPFSASELMSRGLKGLADMAISADMPLCRAPKLETFHFDEWFVLEILTDGHYFYKQREMTSKLRAAADDMELTYHVHCRDKMASRAKLATYEGQTYWSLLCENDKKKVVYLMMDSEGNFVQTSERPDVWVLQQRVAFKKIVSEAKRHGVNPYTRPILACWKGEPVWALYGLVDNKDSFFVCPIMGGDVQVIKYTELNAPQDMKDDKFPIMVGGIEMTAKRWLEAEISEATAD